MTELELRSRVCAQARAWLGLRESDDSYWPIMEVYNSIRPLPRGYAMHRGDFWCAAFVSAVAQKLGLTRWIYPECSCPKMVDLYKAAGRWMEDDDYTSLPGDVIFYDWQDSGQGDNTGVPDHVGIVVKEDMGLLTVIEGNCSRAVSTRYLHVGDKFIRGYGLPNYAAAALVLTEPEEEPEDPGVIVIPNPAPLETVALPALPAGYCYVPLPVLELGAEGEAVRAAQLLLKGRGYSVGWMGADGELGPRTEAALSKFKRDRDLQRTAEIDAKAWESLICE